MKRSSRAGKPDVPAPDAPSSHPHGSAPSAISAPPRRVGRWVAAALIVLLAAGAIVVWASPILGVTSVEVTGTADEQVVAEVRQAAALPEGTPLARVDTAEVAARVGQVAAVAEATVVRRWPHTIAVDVVIRDAVATTQANGQWWSLDDSGVVFGPRPDQPADLIPIELSTPGPADRATLAALAVWRSLGDDIRGRVVSVTAAAPYDVRLALRGGRIVIWGSADDAAVKNEILPALLKQGGQVTDISDPTLATISDG